MLNSIREAIKELPELEFSEFYQEYVRTMQDKIIDHDIQLARHDYTSLEDAIQIMSGLNDITEELKTL